MKRKILLSILILSTGIVSVIKAQETKNKVSLGYVTSIGDNAKQPLNGVELTLTKIII